MINREKHDGQPGSGEAEAEQKSPSLPSYDPLLDPWNGPPAGGRFRPTEGDDLLFPFAWEAEAEPTEAEASLIWEGSLLSPAQWERSVSPLSPAESARSHVGSEGPSSLQRRLQEGTVTVSKRRRRWTVVTREVVETVLLALLIFLVVRTSFQNFRVEGISMLPSFQHGEYLIVNKLAYTSIDLSLFDWLPFFDAGENPVHHLWAAPARGDIIVFRSPTDVDRDFIKRIIGVPGDTIEIDPGSNRVRVNGAAVEESYIQGKTTCGRGCGPWPVPPANTSASYEACGSRACYFVMGDNRGNSSDSRQGWLVPEENIIGKALITYWRDGGPELKLAPNHSVPVTAEAAAEEE